MPGRLPPLSRARLQQGAWRMEPDGALLQLLARARHHRDRSPDRLFCRMGWSIAVFASSQPHCSRRRSPANACGGILRRIQPKIRYRLPPLQTRDVAGFLAQSRERNPGRSLPHFASLNTGYALTLNAGYAHSQLAVAAEHHAAAVAHPPAVGGERRATAHQVRHGQAPGAVAQLRRGRATGRQVLHVDGPRSGDGKPQKCRCKQRFDHAQPHPVCDDTWYPLAAADAKVFFGCHTGLKTYLKILILKHKVRKGGSQKFTIKAISWHFQLSGGRRIAVAASP